MTKKITQEDLLEAMCSPEKLKVLLLITEPIFLETVRLDAEGAEVTFWTCSKYRPRELFEEGLLLLNKLPLENRQKVLSNLKKFNIPSPLWYKIIEDSNTSQTLNSIDKELHMKDNETTGAQAPSIWDTTWGKRFKIGGLFVAGVLVGAFVSKGMYANRHPSSQSNVGVGSGE